jgi:hypothetical protein
MLQVFHMDVVKVDRDVAYVAMVVHLCCKHLWPMFHLFFRCMLQEYLSRYFICFIHMLQVFYLDVVYACHGFKCFFLLFLQVFHMHVLSISYVFICMLQSVVFECFKNRSGVASPSSLSVASPRCLLLTFCCLVSFSATGPVEGVRRG